MFARRQERHGSCDNKINPSRALYIAPKTNPALVNKAMRQKQGSKGRLVIPDLGISVTLRNASKGNAAYIQRLADWNDTAAWSDLNELTGDRNKYQVIIADHAKQNFKNLSQAKKGRTMAYIVTNDRTFAEYYLVWTLLSTLCALTVVAVGKWLAG